MWVLRIEHVLTFKMCEEGMPASNKLSSKFDPQTLNACVVCGAESQRLASASVCVNPINSRAPNERGAVSAIFHDYVRCDIDVLTSMVTPDSGRHSVLLDSRLEEIKHSV